MKKLPVVLYFFSVLFVAGAMEEQGVSSQEQKGRWLIAQTEPLKEQTSPFKELIRELVQNIAQNKNALNSINTDLVLSLKKDSRTASCEDSKTDFLNLFLENVKNIVTICDTESLPAISNEESVNLLKHFDAADALYWPFIYADTYHDEAYKSSEAIKLWKEGEGKEITKNIKKVSELYTELVSFVLNYENLNSFLKDYNSKKCANINIISIGCAGDSKQQVYPWVIMLAQERADLTFSIDLFDQWKFGKPEFLTQSNLNWVTKEDENIYIYNNITVSVRTHLPLLSSFGTLSDFAAVDCHNFYDTLFFLLRKKLKENIVIVSQHTGGYVIDDAFKDFFNQINSENSDIKNRLFLVTHQSGFSPLSEVYNNKIFNSLTSLNDLKNQLELELKKDELTFIQRATIQGLLNTCDISVSKLKELNIESKQEEELEPYLATLENIWIKHLI